MSTVMNMLRQGGRTLALALRPVLPRPVPRRIGPSTIAAPTVFVLLGWLGVGIVQYAAMRPVEGFDIWGIEPLIVTSAAAAAALVLAVGIVGRAPALARLTAPLLTASAIAQVIAWVYWFGASGGKAEPSQLAYAALSASLPALVVLRLFRPSVRNPGRRALPASLIFAGIFGGAIYFLPTTALFYAPYDEGADMYEPVDVEKLYGMQDRLLQDQIDALLPQDPARTDLYALALGGTSSQSVFLREVDQVSALLEERFGTKGRMLSLANSSDDPFRLPMANRANLAKSLRGLADRMDRQQDMALLFLTSHGAADKFSLSFYEAGTTDLTATEFRQMLEEAGLKNLVIVISACKSGSFVDDLAGPDRLIVTAASATRNSFGCGDNVTWTWWGDAYFNHALRGTHDFRAAFRTADRLINRWEWLHWKRASHPQMSEGAAIGAVIDRWIAEDRTRADSSPAMATVAN